MRNRVFLYLLYFASFASIHSKAYAADPADSLILANFYNNTNGPSWTNAWDLTQPVSTWSGVTLDATTGKVTSLFLSSKNISGPLASLNYAGLTSLTTLVLSSNNLTGTIPPLTGMQELQRFEVMANQLTGAIPSLVGVPKITDFYVNNNQLTGTIPSFSGVSNTLQNYVASQNQLSGIIPSISGLTNISQYLVSYNNFTGFEEFTPPASLVQYNINNNQISYTQFENLTNPDFINSLQNVEIFGYSIQDITPHLSISNGTITSDRAEGGTLSNLTYNWYKIVGGVPTLFATTPGSNSITNLSQYGITSTDQIIAEITHSDWTILTGTLKDLAYYTDVVTPAFLPVTFGNLSAKLSNGMLVINWRTLTEINNAHFDIEISRDGSNFKKLAEVKSLATNGNSGSQIDYSFTSDLPTALNFLVPALLLSIGFAGFSKRKKILLGILGLSVIIFANSCTKEDLSADNSSKQKIYVRIAQVDKDGTKSYSKIIQAVDTQN